jgi:CBS domain containing-hemolysin-like protein
MHALATIIEGAVLLLLLVLSAFFSSAETAFFSLNALQVQRIKDRHPRHAPWIGEQIRQPARLLSTLLIGNTLVNIAVSSLGYALIDAIPGVGRYSAVVAIPVMTIILLIFGEVAPKRYAILHAERLLPRYSPLIRFWMVVLRPLGLFLAALTKRVEHSFKPERKSLTDEELLTAVELGAETGVLDEEERSMVDGIMRLSEMTASDVMIPRVDIEGLDLEDTPTEHLATARRTHYHYLPVYRETPDAIEGFLDVPRYLLDPEHNLRQATFAALFVPETIDLDDLLITLQRNHLHIACVLDEFGGTAGLISRGDILETITGEILLGSEQEAPEIQTLADNRWLVDGSTSLDEINHELDLELDAEGVDRIGGWVTAQAGRFLRAGEAVEAQGCRVQVRRLRKLRIEQVILERLSRPTPDQYADTDPDATETGRDTDEPFFGEEA